MESFERERKIQKIARMLYLKHVKEHVNLQNGGKI